MILSKNIRFVVCCFSLVIAVMLLQTPVYGLGTAFAFGTMGLTALAYFNTHSGFNRGQSSERILLIFLSVYIFFQTGLSSYSTANESLKFIAQTLLTYLLLNISLREREQRFMKYAYELFISIWSIFIIQSCIAFRNIRYVHGSIALFGSEIDPNYIGIPLVTASILLLNDILNVPNKKLWPLFIIGYTLIVIAIIETASRGNFLSFILGNGILFYNYIRTEKRSLKKYFVLLMVTCGIFYGMLRLSNVFQDNFDRMMELDSESGGRLVLWTYSLNLWLTDLFTFVWGNGYGAVKSMGIDNLCSHNTYMQLLSETGIIGFLLYISFVWKMLKKCYHSDKILALCLFVTLFQIAFLNALDNRCVWGLLGWVAMIPAVKCNNLLK